MHIKISSSVFLFQKWKSIQHFCSSLVWHCIGQIGTSLYHMPVTSALSSFQTNNSMMSGQPFLMKWWSVCVSHLNLYVWPVSRPVLGHQIAAISLWAKNLSQRKQDIQQFKILNIQYLPKSHDCLPSWITQYQYPKTYKCILRTTTVFLFGIFWTWKDILLLHPQFCWG